MKDPGTGAPTLDAKPSRPQLQGLTIGEVNETLASVHDNHMRLFGTSANPGLVFDVVRGVAQEIVRDVNHLFDLPRDRREAALRAIATAAPKPNTVTAEDPDAAAALERAQGHPLTASQREALNLAQGKETVFQAREHLREAGVLPKLQVVHDEGDLFNRIMAGSLNASLQVVGGIALGLPATALAEGRAIGASVKQGSVKPFAQTNAMLAKGVYHGLGRDIHNPGENAGNLILDLWGLASLGAGTAGRVGAAGRALAEGAGARAVARAALAKASPGSYRLGEGADLPLSTNPLAAKIQTYLLDRKTAAEPEPAGALAALFDAFGLRTRYLGLPSKTQRQLRAADRIDRDVRLALLDPVLRANQSAVTTAGVIAKMPRRWLGLSAAEQKAIQVLATDDPTPFQTWRGFHERAIENGWGDGDAHRAHLDLLGPAEKAAANPSPKLAQAIEAVRQAMVEQTIVRIRLLGLAPEQAEGRVASVGEVVRGELRNPARNEIVPALTGKDEILRLAALGRTAEQIAAELVKPHPETAGELGRPRYTSEAEALKAVRAKLATPEAKVALTPQRVRSATANPDAHYLPFVSPAKTRAPGSFWGMRANKYGIPVPSTLPELNHAFTGDSIRAGDFRIDATNLARESYVRTVHVASKLNAWKRLWEHYADETPLSEYHQPIRDRRAVDEYLKGLLSNIEQGHLSEADLAGLPEDAIENLNRFLYPSRAEVKPGEQVRWVDSRLLDDPRSGRPGGAAKVFSAVNEPLRDLTLFLRPAYLINVLGNAGMLAMQAGVLAIPNLVRALKASEWYGPHLTRVVDALAGESRTLSYSPDVGAVTRVSHALAAGWNVITDRIFRRAAVIHELRREGFRTTEEIKDALTRMLDDPELHKRVVAASQRAKKAMVELDNLTWAERQYLRHIVFVYPWMSRSFVWSLRFLRDHPGQAAIVNEIGHSQEIEEDPILKHLPGWMQDAGVMPVAWDKSGNPLVVNPASVSTWSTIGEAAGLTRGDETISDLFGAGAEIALHTVTNRDRFGRAYAHRWQPLVQQLEQLPQVAAFSRAQQQEPDDLPGNDVTSLRGLVREQHAEAKAPLYVPGGFLNVFGPLLFGGLTPRVLDRKAVEARFWRDQPYPSRIKHETALMQREAAVQAALVGRGTVPEQVREGIRLSGLRALAYHDFAAKNGRTPTLRERTSIDIGVLEGRHLISSEQAQRLRDQLAHAAPGDLAQVRSDLLDQHAYGTALTRWHSDVLTVAQGANRDRLDASLQMLVGAGLLDPRYRDAADTGDKTLLQYGRGYLAYVRGVRKLSDKIDALQKRNEDTGEARAALRGFVDEHAASVVVDGHTLPPYPSLALARLNADQRAALKVRIYTAPWLSLAATDKQLTGYKVNPKVAQALVAYAHYTSPEYLATVYPAGERHLDGGQKLAIVKQLDRSYDLHGDLVREYRFAQLPRFERYQRLAIYSQSPNRSLWRDLFGRARELYDLAHPKDGQLQITEAAMNDAWHEWTAQLLPLVKRDYPSFYAELQPYLAHNPSFLDDLVKGESNG